MGFEIDRLQNPIQILALYTGFANELSLVWIYTKNTFKEVAYPGPLLTKRMDVLPQDLAESRSRDMRI